MSRAPLPVAGRRLDAESIEWLDALSASDGRREEAVERPHALLPRAARFEVARRRRSIGTAHADDLALQAADDALMAILRKLHTHRGDSRFTTPEGCPACREDHDSLRALLEAEPPQRA